MQSGVITKWETLLVIFQPIEMCAGACVLRFTMAMGGGHTKLLRCSSDAPTINLPGDVEMNQFYKSMINVDQSCVVIPQWRKLESGKL